MKLDRYELTNPKKYFDWGETQVKTEETAINKEEFISMQQQHQHQHH